MLSYIRATMAENDQGEQLQKATNPTPIDHCVPNHACLTTSPSHCLRRLSSSRPFNRGESKSSSHAPSAAQARISKGLLAVSVLVPWDQ